MMLAVDQIKPGDQLRPPKDAIVRSLAFSIATAGLVRPIVVTKDRKGYKLVTGGGTQRLAAVKTLVRDQIECDVIDHQDLYRKLYEINDTMLHGGLNQLELAEAVGIRRHLLHTTMTEHGGDRRSAKFRRDKKTADYISQTAGLLGVSRITMMRIIRRIDRISAMTRKIIKEEFPNIANNAAELDRLANESYKTQQFIIELLQSQQATTVRSALQIIEGAYV